MTTTQPELDLVLERESALTPAQIWAGWTQPDLIVQWFTPKPWQTLASRVDLRPGGEFFTTMRGPEGEEFSSAGCILAVEPERRLVFTSALGPGFRPAPESFAEPGLAFTGIIEIEPTEQGSRYRAIAVHGDAETCRRHADMGFHNGWGAAFDQLVELMSTR